MEEEEVFFQEALTAGDQESIGGHGQGDVAVPAMPGADFVLIQTELRPGFLIAAFDSPTRPGGQRQVGQRDGLGGEGQISGERPIPLAADQQIALADEIGQGIDRLRRPVGVARSLTPGPQLCPGVCGSVARGRCHVTTACCTKFWSTGALPLTTNM